MLVTRLGGRWTTRCRGTPSELSSFLLDAQGVSGDPKPQPIGGDDQDSNEGTSHLQMIVTQRITQKAHPDCICHQYEGIHCVVSKNRHYFLGPLTETINKLAEPEKS